METKNKHSILKIPLMLLVGVVVFSFGVSAVSAAGTSDNSTIYVSTGGNDTWDGLSPVYNTTSGPKKTITNATGTVAANGTVHIAQGTYNESGIIINQNMTIIGENQDNTIINGQQSGNRIFTILPGITVNINNLTLTNTTLGAILNIGGNLTVGNSTFTGNTATNDGGAIYNSGTLTVINSTFTGNKANDGGAIFSYYGDSLTVDNSTFTGNNATNGGGAIFNGGSLSLGNSTFTGNTATNLGGAVCSYYRLTVGNSTFTDNTAGIGGAIYNAGSILTVDNSTFIDNKANDGGAIYNCGGSLTADNNTFTGNTATGNGGAIFNSNSLTMVNSTFTGNTATGNGGAIYNYYGDSLTVGNSTFTDNTAKIGGAIYNYYGDSLTVGNSTFTDNTAKIGGAIYNAGSILTVDNSTFTGNTAGIGGAIYNGGSLTVGNSTFTSNTATGNGGAILNLGGNLTVGNSTFTGNTATNDGGAIYNYYGGSLTVDNSTFTGNTATSGGYGGAIFNSGGSLTVGNSTFTDNTATNGSGGAICNEGGNLSVSNSTFTGNTAAFGGALNNDNCRSTVSNSTFTGNTADDAGGAIFNIGGSLTVGNSTFTGNNAGLGGAICNDGSLTVINSTFTGNRGRGGAIFNRESTGVHVSFCRIINNGQYDIYNDNNGSVNATLNWWGSNDNPSARVNSGVDVSPWLVLTVGSDNSTISLGGNSTVTADLQHDSDNTYHDPVNEGHVPDGIPVTFNLSDTSLGSLNTISSILTNGTALTIFAAIKSGIENITATADTQPESTLITINKLNTALVVGDVTVYDGQTATINATLTDENGDVLTGKTVTFRVNGIDYDKVTDSNGIATLNYKTTKAGVYIVTVNFGNDTTYANSTSNGTLTVNPVAYLYLNTTTSNKNPKADQTFILTYKLSNNGPDNATNVTVSFQVPAGLEFVSVSVDNGTVTYNTTTRTVTWNLTNVEVGDPYLYLTVRALGTGSYSITPTITSETFNRNTDPLTPFSINVQAQNNSNSNTVNAASTTKTVPMQTTGMPIAGLILAILAVLGGIFTPRKK